MTKEIPLSQQGKYKGLYVVLVDDWDFDAVNAYRWCVMRAGNTRYAIRFEIVNGKQVTVLMHRAIIAPGDDLSIDHINGNGLDNRRSNLRACTHADNLHNNRKSKAGGRFKGVVKIQSGRYSARIGYKGKTVCLGTFALEIDAALAYNAAAERLYGEFARPNEV